MRVIKGLRMKLPLTLITLILFGVLLTACGNRELVLNYQGEPFKLESMSGDVTETKLFMFASQSGERMRFEVNSFSAIQDGTNGKLLQSSQEFRFFLKEGEYEATIDTADGTIQTVFPDGRRINGNLAVDGTVTPFYSVEVEADVQDNDILQLAADFERISAGRQVVEDVSHFNGTLFLIGVLLLAAGIANVAFPQAMWWLSEGWKFQNAEPSDLALTVGRIGGVILLIVSFIIIVSSCGI
jgi:hypothetical protein